MTGKIVTLLENPSSLSLKFRIVAIERIKSKSQNSKNPENLTSVFLSEGMTIVLHIVCGVFLERSGQRNRTLDKHTGANYSR